MKMKFGYAAFACLFLLGACAHAPPQAAPITYERIEGTIREVESRAEPAERAVASKSSVDESTVDATMPAGIDLTKFELPMQYNERVQEYVDLYTKRRRTTFTTWMRRMGRYRSMIEDRLDAHGLPRELVYLPLIESMYEANAASNASAVGLWQFMAGTARSEGLQVNEYVDERRDPIRSTDAAIRHLSGLYNQFGSWYLTAAAYNSGSTRIARLLKEHGYRKGQDDAFWLMQDALPKETRDYVPMLLAAILIGENAETFGITATPDKEFKFETVMVPGSTDLRAVARAAGVAYDELKALNFHYIKGMTPPDERSEVRVPVGTSEGFAEAFAKIPKSERSKALGRDHVVKSGETLSHIARKYGTTVDALTRVNRIKRPDAVAVGRKLVIPSGS